MSRPALVDRAAVKRLKKRGFSNRAIAGKLGVSHTAVNAAIRPRVAANSDAAKLLQLLTTGGVLEFTIERHCAGWQIVNRMPLQSGEATTLHGKLPAAIQEAVRLWT